MESFLRLYLLGAILLDYAIAQTYCSCTPLIYHWKLDFSGTCPPLQVPVGIGHGVSHAFCKVTGYGTDNITPVTVTAYTIIELDDELTPLKIKAEKNLNMTDGNFIYFSSLTAAEPNVYAGGLQAEITAKNSLGESLRLVWILAFSNICETLPFLSGNSLGWMRYEDSSDKARPESCLVRSNEPSSAPFGSSSSPSILPSIDDYAWSYSYSYSMSYSYDYDWNLSFEELDQYLEEFGKLA